jgi:hypothetical protein
MGLKRKRGLVMDKEKKKYIPYKEDFGICTKCGKLTELGDPCCYAPVEFEGELYTPEFFEEENGYPLDYPNRAYQIYLELKREGY